MVEDIPELPDSPTWSQHSQTEIHTLQEQSHSYVRNLPAFHNSAKFIVTYYIIYKMNIFLVEPFYFIAFDLLVLSWNRLQALQHSPLGQELCVWQSAQHSL